MQQADNATRYGWATSTYCRESWEAISQAEIYLARGYDRVTITREPATTAAADTWPFTVAAFTRED